MFIFRLINIAKTSELQLYYLHLLLTHYRLQFSNLNLTTLLTSEQT